MNDPIVIQSSSSIALLQERFRQLQRVKKMREEKELHRMQCYYYHEPSRFFFHFLPYPPPKPQVTVWSNSETKLLENDEFQCMETPLLMSLQPITATTMKTTSETSSMHAAAKKFGTCNFDDVDTSLHL